MFSLFHRSDTSLLKASAKERTDAIERLIEQGTLRNGYYMLLLVATLIVTPGLLLNNVAVVIGGMILAPLLVPILSFSLSLVAGNANACLRSLRILGVSIVVTFATSAAMTFILAETRIVVSWIPERIDTGVYIFIAFCSGIAASFAWVKENLSSSVAGVAVAVSLLPPLCAAGIGFAFLDHDLIRNSLVLFAANLLGISAAGVIVFWILGFISAGTVQEKVLEKNGK